MKKKFICHCLLFLFIISILMPFFAYKKLLSNINFINQISTNPLLQYNQPSTTTYLSNVDNSYIKNSITAKYLYVISENDMTREEQTMIATIQGIISTKSDNQIYVLCSNEPDYKLWLEDLNKNYNVKYNIIKDPWVLFNKFKSYINGYILYSNANSPSINNACSLASLKDSVAIDESLESKVKSYGVTSLIRDCRDTDKYWAYNNLWNCGLNHSSVIELSPEKTMALRDYAIISKSLIFYEDDVNDATFRETIFNSMNDNSHCLGWGPDEHTNVSIASKFGVDVIAADWTYNLSVLSSYPSIPLTQKDSNTIPNEDNVHYITFIMSDGDNQQWYLGSNYSSPKWFGSNHRGNFNLGWSISPSLYYLAPTVYTKYYQNAGSLSHTDNFIVPPSGNGYMYPSQFPIKKLDTYTSLLSSYMNEVDQKYVLILDDGAFYKTDLWDKYTCHSDIKGLFYLDYKKHNSYDGKIIWSNNKPVVSCRDLLWDGLENESQLIANINDRIKLGYTDITNQNSYTFVYVHVWSKTMDNVQDIINRLNENPKSRIVTPDTFMKLIKDNVIPNMH